MMPTETSQQMTRETSRPNRAGRSTVSKAAACPGVWSSCPQPHETGALADAGGLIHYTRHDVYASVDSCKILCAP
jgi:hypothetical protein